MRRDRKKCISGKQDQNSLKSRGAFTKPVQAMKAPDNYW